MTNNSFNIYLDRVVFEKYQPKSKTLFHTTELYEKCTFTNPNTGLLCTAQTAVVMEMVLDV